MSQPTHNSPGTLSDRDAWREDLRRRMAEDGLTLHIPSAGRKRRMPSLQLPFTGDELSEAVLRMRRGED